MAQIHAMTENKCQEYVELQIAGEDLDFSLDALKKFKNVEYLSLKDDHLEQLPMELFELRQLKVLDLSGNDFSQLPEEFARLDNLEELYLNNEKRLDLTQTIDVLSRMPNLKSLHLEGDQINEFPENIFKLDQLEKLYLNDNELEQIPQGIEQMNQLKYLDLQSNPIPRSIQNTFVPEGNVLIRF